MSARNAKWFDRERVARMKIVHQGSGQEFVQPLRWSSTRHAVSSWRIPPAAGRRAPQRTEGGAGRTERLATCPQLNHRSGDGVAQASKKP